MVAPGAKVERTQDAHRGTADGRTDDRKQQHRIIFQSWVFRPERSKPTGKVASLFPPSPNLSRHLTSPA